MPVARFQMPDGRIARFEVPEGTTPEQAQEMIKKSLESGPPQRSDISAQQSADQTGSFARDLTRSALQGFTFGMSDEIGAGLAAAVAKAAQTAGVSPGEEGYLQIYRDMKKQLESEQKAFQEENPAASFAAELGGGLLTGGGAVKSLGKAPGLLGIAKEGAKQGAKYGALYGAGTSETGDTVAESAINTAEGALKGGVIGAATGGLISPAVAGTARVASSGVKRAKDALNSKAITGGDDITNAVTDEEAAAIVGEIAEKAGLTSDDIAKKIESLGSKATMADVDENFAYLLHDAVSRFSPAKSSVRKQYAERLLGEHSDVIGSLSKQFNNYSADDVYSALEKSAERRKNIAGPLYKKAFQLDFPENLSSKKIFRLENVQKALKEGERLAKNDPERLMTIDGKTTTSPIGAVERIHYAKKALWDQAQELKRAGKNEEARLIDSQRKAIDEVLNSVPEYAKARKIWSGSLEADAAADVGKDIFKFPVREFQKELSRMNPHEKEMAKMGALSSAADKIEGTADKRSVARKLVGDEGMRKKVESLFGGRKEVESLMDSADKWDTFRRTNAILSQQSKTREFTQASQEIDSIVSALSKKASQQVLDAIKGERMNSERANLVARILSKEGMSRQDIKRIIDLNRKMFTPGKGTEALSKAATIHSVKLLEEK